MRAGDLPRAEGRSRTKRYRVELTDHERTESLRLTHSGTTPARTLTRAHILLPAAEDAYDRATAEVLSASVRTAQHVCQRFAAATPDESLAHRRALHGQLRPRRHVS